MSPLDLPDLTVWTTAGIVDLVACQRWLRGEDVPLTDVEALVLAHACARGLGPSLNDYARRTGRNVHRLLKTPAPTPTRTTTRTALVPHRKAA